MKEVNEGGQRRSSSPGGKFILGMEPGGSSRKPKIPNPDSTGWNPAGGLLILGRGYTHGVERLARDEGIGPRTPALPPIGPRSPSFRNRSCLLRPHTRTYHKRRP